MLCPACQEFLTDILTQSFVSWNRPHADNPDWVTFVVERRDCLDAIAEARCELCWLFDRVHNQKSEDQENIPEKAHVRPDPLVYEIGYDEKHEDTSKWAFHLIAVNRVEDSGLASCSYPAVLLRQPNSAAFHPSDLLELNLFLDW